MSVRLFAAALVAASGAAAAHADLVAYWNFNANATSGSTASFPIAAAYAANGGINQLENLNFAPSNALLFTPSGASDHGGLNGLSQYGDVKGNDLGLQTGTAGVNNGKSVVFHLNTTSFSNLIMTFAGRRTTTGFTSIDVSTSANGTTYTSAGSITNLNSSAYALVTFDLSAATNINNVANAYIKFTFQGTGTSSAGNVRIDNLQINTPAPGSLSMLAAAGVMAGRRRRR